MVQRYTMGWCFLGGLCLLILSSRCAWGAPPLPQEPRSLSDTDELKIPGLDELPPKSSSGSAASGKQSGENNDASMQEAMKILKRNGSLLRGSVIEELGQDEPRDAKPSEIDAKPAEMDEEFLDSPPREYYLAAESMLRAARLLEKSSAREGHPNKVRELRRMASEVLNTWGVVESLKVSGSRQEPKPKTSRSPRRLEKRN